MATATGEHAEAADGQQGERGGLGCYLGNANFPRFSLLTHSNFRLLAIFFQIIDGDRVGWDKPVMLFGIDSDTFLTLLEREERYEIVGHELRGYRLAHQIMKLFGANGDILFDLHDVQPFRATLGLSGNRVMHTPAIETNVKFVSLDLAHSFESRSKVTLQRITR
jgi:hypothetical protein